MRSSAQALRLDTRDTARWLWSYYASRLPGAGTRSTRTTQIAVRNLGGTERLLFIRNNGYDWSVADEIFARCIYRNDVTRVARILDLGGNIGLSALWFAWNYPGAEICTVEPIPDNLAILRLNVELNSPAITVIAAAAGPADGTARFPVSADPRLHSNVIASPQTDRTVDAAVWGVPSLMLRMGWESIDLMKIDIEGGERELLAGRPSWLKQVRCIVGEGHVAAGYGIEACRADLEPMGFRVRQTEQNSGAMIFVARRPE
jgi:FkbM family methyltransferase